jgi:FKBP-type peptidyl-prolyl cis-trans isomerase FkpA
LRTQTRASRGIIERRMSMSPGVCLVRVFRSTLTFVALVALPALVAGCGGTPTSPSASVPFSQVDLRVGTGADAVSGSVLAVNYTGWLYDASKPEQKGAQIDSSVGGTAFTFTLGAGHVISGWDQGVLNMKVGGLRRLVIPPSLGYGVRRSGPIPPNATLVFEIELLDVQ